MSKQGERLISGHLNNAINRFQLNRPKKVGSTDEALASAIPTSLECWQEYYFENVRKESHLEQIGDELYEKFRNIILPEIKSITPEDCRNYVKELVIVKSYEGHQARLGILQQILKEKTSKEFIFKPETKDDWRFRDFQIDFYHLDIGKDLLIGIKAYPESFEKSPNLLVLQYKKDVQETHRYYAEKGAGRFCLIYYRKLSNDIYELTDPSILKEIEEL